MRRNMLSFALMTGAVLAPLAARAASPPQLKSLSVDFPQSDRMFTGQGADARHAVLHQEERHTCAGRFIGSGAEENDVLVPRDLGVTPRDLLGGHVEP